MGGPAAESMRAGAGRGPPEGGAAGVFAPLPAPNETPPGTTGPAPDAGPDAEAAPLANGTERVCDSVPYQNSVVSHDGRCRVRMTRGVIDSTISFLSWVVPFVPNSRPRMGRSPSPGMLRRAHAGRCPGSSPASTCVSPSLSSSSVDALRVPIS